MKLNGAQIIMECLAREGTEVIFGLPGGANLPLYDALPSYPQIKHVLVRHEQGAAHAADGYARATGKVGVCFATSGPGATNLVTGIANAWMDSVPMVAITGQVVTLAHRQRRLPGSGHHRHHHPDHQAQLPGAGRGRPGDGGARGLPHRRHGTAGAGAHRHSAGRHAAADRVPLPGEGEPAGLPAHRPGPPAQVKKAAQLIDERERPVILAGHGVILSRANDELRDLAEKAQIPVIATLLGTGRLPRAPIALFMGMLGMHGMYWNNIAISEADLHRGDRHALRRPGDRARSRTSRRTPRSSTSTSTRRRSARTSSRRCRSSAT